MEKFVKSVVAAYQNDPSAPSVVVSWLNDGDGFYVSVVRYREKFGQGKYVVTSARHTDLSTCLSGLKELFDGLQQRDGVVQRDGGVPEADAEACDGLLADIARDARS